VVLKGSYQTLPEVEEYDHLLELYDSFDELRDTIFWNSEKLKYARHSPGKRSADILEKIQGVDEVRCFYYSVGEPVLFGEENFTGRTQERIYWRSSGRSTME